MSSQSFDYSWILKNIFKGLLGLSVLNTNFNPTCPNQLLKITFKISKRKKACKLWNDRYVYIYLYAHTHNQIQYTLNGCLNELLWSYKKVGVLKYRHMLFKGFIISKCRSVRVNINRLEISCSRLLFLSEIVIWQQILRHNCLAYALFFFELLSKSCNLLD